MLVKYYLSLFLVCNLFYSCVKSREKSNTSNITISENNPFLNPKKNHFFIIPFDKVKNDHYLPAFFEGIKIQNEEIKDIIDVVEAPNIENTILPLYRSGVVIRNVNFALHFTNRFTCNTKIDSFINIVDSVSRIQERNIYGNVKLFNKVSTIVDQRNKINLKPEYYELLINIYRLFLNHGMSLNVEKRNKLKNIIDQESILTQQLFKKTSKERQLNYLCVDNKDSLKGLTIDQLEYARRNANGLGFNNSYVFYLDESTQQLIFENLENRNIRKQLYELSISRNSKNDINNTTEDLKKLIQLRNKRAQLFGFKTYNHLVLAGLNIKTQENLDKFFKKLIVKANKAYTKIIADIKKISIKDNIEKLEPWDIYYYKRKTVYENVPDSFPKICDFLSLDTVVNKGIFFSLEKLFGIQFKERFDVPKSSPDARVYEILDENKAPIGLLNLDYYKKNCKKGGIYTEYLANYFNYKITVPVIYCYLGITPPLNNSPKLLNLKEYYLVNYAFSYILYYLFEIKLFPNGNILTKHTSIHSSLFNEVMLNKEIYSSYAKSINKQKIPEKYIKELYDFNIYTKDFSLVEMLQTAIIENSLFSIENFENDKNFKLIEKEILKKHNMLYPLIPPRIGTNYFQHFFNSEFCALYFTYLTSEQYYIKGQETNILEMPINRKTGEVYKQLMFNSIIKENEVFTF